MRLTVTDMLPSAEGAVPVDMLPTASPIQDGSMCDCHRQQGTLDRPAATGRFRAKAENLLGR
jgi:hypothetical protein